MSKNFYAVYVRNSKDSQKNLQTEDDIKIVKDSFNKFALFFAPLWLIKNKMWLYLLLYVALTFTFNIFIKATIGLSMGFQIYIISGFFIGVNAPYLEEAYLKSKRYSLANLYYEEGQTEVLVTHAKQSE